AAEECPGHEFALNDLRQSAGSSLASRHSREVCNPRADRNGTASAPVGEAAAFSPTTPKVQLSSDFQILHPGFATSDLQGQGGKSRMQSSSPGMKRARELSERKQQTRLPCRN